MSSEERWAQNMDWAEERRAHDEACVCEACHAHHLKRHLVVENALDNPADYPCCVDEFEEMKKDGRVCKLHPRAYFEPRTATTPAFCEQCEL